MAREAKQNQLRDYLNAERVYPIARDGIRIEATCRLEALVWKLRISLLFIGAAIQPVSESPATRRASDHRNRVLECRRHSI